MTLVYSRDGSRAWIDDDERQFLRLRPVGREDRRNVTVAELEEEDGAWPGSDPAAVEALCKLSICVLRVAEIDDANLRQFTRLT